jgi:hypothetical protein
MGIFNYLFGRKEEQRAITPEDVPTDSARTHNRPLPRRNRHGYRSPLAVALGGSDVPYTDVRSLSAVDVDDVVDVLVWGNDLLVLGVLF